MNDLERIQHIEETLGIKLNKVSLENVFTEKYFLIDFGYFIIEIQKPYFAYKGVRNYSVDESGNVTGLALDFCNLLLLDNKFLAEFKYLKKLKLKSSLLRSYSFLIELTNLEELDLSGNNLSRVDFLRELKSLTSLNLRNNNLSNVDFLGELKNLTLLDLSNNKLSNHDFLGKLKNLTSLYLSNNNLSDIGFLRELESLTLLDLNENGLTNVDFLKELTNLTSLDLSSNTLSNVHFLGELKNLTSLDLSSNSLSNADFLKEQTNLTSLYLAYNKLTGVDFLKELTNLTSLDLSNNKLLNYDFPEELKNLTSLYLTDTSLSNYDFLKELKNLTLLDLTFNKLTDADFLKELKNLTSLDLGFNNLSDVSFLSELKNLNLLYLGNNNLSNFDFLGELKNLTVLDLSENDITDARFLVKQKNLISLDLGKNKLSDVSFLVELKNLISLDLISNYISDAAPLSELKSLTHLDLRRNNLSSANFLKELKNLTQFYLSEASNLDLPKTLKKSIEENGRLHSLNRNEIDQIVAYYRQLADENEFIYEAKVLVVGEPKAGKTTLTQKIKDNDFWTKEIKDKESTQTIGVDINTLLFPYHKDKSQQITAHFWDFGGQDIQYVLHQYFFTERSLYVLLADGRKELPNFNYWFEIIATLGRSCPVLVVLNENGGKPVKTFNINDYREQFSEYLESIEEESVNFYEDEDGRFENLKNKIQNKTSNLRHIGSPLPKKWVDVRNEIEKLKDENAYIEKDKFLEICRKFKLTNKDYQEQLRDYLHDLGIALNYKNDFNLRHKFILKPNWVIDALYVVLKDNKIERDCGRFEVDYVEELWQREGYSLKDCELLLGLMQKGKFEIAYKIKDNEFIVPILLPYKPSIEYKLEDINEIQTQFEYKFMPKGIVPRLIVRLHKSIVVKNGGQIVWNKGVLLSHHNSIAEVAEKDQSKQITIRVVGENIIHNKELLTIIRNEIIGIHRDWFENRLKFDEFVPCICDTCKELKIKFESLPEDELKNLSDDQRKGLALEPYKLFELQDRIRKNVYTIECRKSYKPIEIPDLLKDTYVIATEGGRETKNIIISNISGTVIVNTDIQNSALENLVKPVGDYREIEKKLDAMFEKINDAQAVEMEKLMDEFLRLVDEKLVKTNRLSAEQAREIENLKLGSDLKAKVKYSLPMNFFISQLTGVSVELEKEWKVSREIKADSVISLLRKINRGDDLQITGFNELE